MTDNAFVYWILAHLLALMVLATALLFIAYCVWDFWGRYKAMLREAEKAKRE